MKKKFELELSLFGEFWGNRITAPSTELYVPKLHQSYLMIYILYIIFSAISSTRNRDKLNSKILEKGATTALPLEQFLPKVDRNQFM